MSSLDFSRRQFLQSSAAAATAAVTGLAPAAAPAQSAPNDPFGGFIVAIQSYTFRNFNLEQMLKRTQDLGLRYAEFYQQHCPMTADPTRIRAFLSTCKDFNVTPVAWGVQRFTKDHDANKRIFDFGKALELRNFSADPDPDSFDSLDRLCAEYEIAIAIHPHGPVGGKLHRWYSARVIMDAVRNHHRLIGSCLDTGHLIRAAQLGEKLVPEQEVRTMGARNFGMHLKDHNNEKRTDVVFGRDGGVLNVVEVLRALREVRFQGTISIEYEANPQEPTADVRACIDVIKDAVRKLG